MPFPSPGDLPNPGIKPGFPALQADSLPTELQGKPNESESCIRLFMTPWTGQNPGVGSLSLLQGIFPTQGSNPGLPHFRHILYQLSHEGSPNTQVSFSHT